MKIVPFLIASIVIVGLLIEGYAIQRQSAQSSLTNQISSAPSSSPSLTISVNPSTAGSSATPNFGKVSHVKIYMIALNDNGKSGKKVGCGDSLVAVTQRVEPTTIPLQAAYMQLISYKKQYYGESGLYNALYQSQLQVQDITLDSGGVATVKLSGTYALGGECDAPRFAGQLTETALQFPNVKSVKVFINNTLLDKITSEK